MEATEGVGLCFAEFDEDMARANKPRPGTELQGRNKMKKSRRTGFSPRESLEHQALLLQLVVYGGARTR